MNDNLNIKSMNLYKNVDRVFNELREIGKSSTDSLQVEDLTKFDQFHYHGTDAIDISIKKLGIHNKTKILDIGSGIGGLARYIASKTGAKITAIELQEDQNNLASDLTSRCGLSDKINHICGDILNYDFKSQKFDAVVSWLTLYHISNHKDLLNVMINELYNHNPLFGHLGIFGCNARLIKSSIIHDNKIFFCVELRYLEDKTFGWDILGFAKNIYYLKKQLYSYNVFPNVSTAIIDGVNNGFPLSNFKLVKKHIEQSLRNKGLSENEVLRCGDQGFIFFIITLLVSYSRCIILKKVEFNKGKKSRKKIINEIIHDIDISNAIKNYTASKQESYWIPKSIAFKSCFFLEFACDLRAKETIQMRRTGKS